MPETALMVPSNLSHNVPAAIETAKTCLTDLATLYLATEVAGQSQATLEAKHRDLKRLLAFYHQLYGHDRPDEWYASVTKAFLKHLRGRRFAQASSSASTRPCATSPAGSIANSLTSSRSAAPPTESSHRQSPQLTRKVSPAWRSSACSMPRSCCACGPVLALGNVCATIPSWPCCWLWPPHSEVLQLDRDQYTGKGFVRVQMKAASSVTSCRCNATHVRCSTIG
jgi:hypothetical protein